MDETAVNVKPRKCTFTETEVTVIADTRKEIPECYIPLLIYKSMRVSSQHKEWICIPRVTVFE
jgi:hypothetical protein